VAASRQAGIPISVKLILATSIVVAAAVGIVTWFARTTMDKIAEDQISKREADGQKAIRRSSEQIVGNAAVALSFPLPNHVEQDIKIVLDEVIKSDKASGEQRLKWIAVLENRKLTYFAGERPTDDAVAKYFRALNDAENSEESRESAKAGGVVVRAPLGNAEWVYRAPITGAGLKGTHVLAGVSTAGLEASIVELRREAKDSAGAEMFRALLVSLVVLAIGILLAAIQGTQLAKPIKGLTAQAERIGSGDLSFRVADDRRDELGVLARTFNVMADAITGLLYEQAQKASLEKEMELARQVQQAMLPPDILDEHGSLKVVGYCMPASSCGGDWWTYRKLTNGRMLLVVGDATGHGIHSAMIAATARGAVEALSGIDERLLTPEQVLRAIDSAIRQVGEHNVLMTAFAAVFDSTNGVLHYANAGQNFPYVLRLGATRILEEASIIAASGNPLGDRNIAVEIRRGSLQLRPGDLFVCFTDGVVERANPAGKLFGDRRLRSALTGQSIPDATALLKLRDSLVGALADYGETAIPEDDITFVFCHYDPASPARQSARRSVA
jgi:serine phosphatase RsbU (regulator of sigma subunit)